MLPPSTDTPAAARDDAAATESMTVGLAGRRVGLDQLAIVGGALLFLVLALAVKPFAIGFDEAKYLGVGANIWAGNGPYTAFGTLFLLHSPLWMTVLYGPQALVGVDAVWWGHLLNALAGATVVLVTGIWGRRGSGLAGVLAVGAILAFTYLFLLSRTTRLDVPAAAMAMLYLEVGWQAIVRGSRRWAIAAGLTFAVAVLVKEVAIPIAPVPIICGVLAGIEWRRVLRTGAWLTLFAALGLAPWFVYYAANTGRVYRVESPAWTLPLLLVPVLVVVVIGLAAPRVAASRSFASRADAGAARLPAVVRDHGRALVGWGVTVGWTAAFFVFFSRISRLKGGPLIDVPQFALYFRTWRWDVVPIGAYCALGALLAIALLLGDRRAPERRGAVNALVATICGIPLVVMVAAVGEPPRNYLAQVGTAVALGSIGWAWAIRRLATAIGSRTAGARLLAVAAAIGLLVGTVALGSRTVQTATGSGSLSTDAIRTTVEWVRTHVPKGTPIAFGSYLSYEMAYGLVKEYPTYQVRHRMVTADPSMPLGFVRHDEPPADDWVAADAAPRNVNEYQAFRAEWVERLLRDWRIGYWIYTTGIDTSSPSILPQLVPEHGFEEVAGWRFADPDGAYREVHVFKVDPEKVALDHERLYIAPDALHRLVNRLEEDPAASRDTAARLLERVVPTPASAETDADLARLKALAAGG